MAYEYDTAASGITVKTYVEDVIRDHITKQLKNKLVQIQEQYRKTTEQP